MRRLSCLLVCIALSGAALLAQSTPQPRPGKAAVERYLRSPVFEDMWKVFEDEMVKSFLKGTPDGSKYEAVVRSFFGKYFSWELVKQDMVAEASSGATEAELNLVSDYFESSAGKKAMRKIKGEEVTFTPEEEKVNRAFEAGGGDKVFLKTLQYIKRNLEVWLDARVKPHLEELAQAIETRKAELQKN